MKAFLSGHSDEETRKIRDKLVIVEALIFLLPFLVLSYIFYYGRFSFELSHLLMLSVMVVLVLTGLIIVRQIFDKISCVAVSMKKAATGDAAPMDVKKDVAELHDISVSFNHLIQRLEETTEELSQRAFELFTIRELTDIAGKSLNMDELLENLLAKSMSVTGAQIASVLIHEPEFNRFRVAAVKGHGKLEKGSCIGVDETVAGLILREGKPLLVEDIEKDPRILKENHPRYGAPSFLSMPLLTGNTVSAVLNLANKKTGRTFSDHDEHVLSIMHGEIGFALENATLHLKVKEQLKKIQEDNARLEREMDERRRTQNDLIESEKKYRLLVENSNDIIYATDLKGTFIYANPVAERILGFPRSELIGRHFHSIADPDYHERMEAFYKKQFRETIPNTYFEFPITVQGGATRWIGQNVQLLIDNQKPVGFQAVARDVTDRRRAEEDLRRSLINLAEAQRIAHMGSWEWDPQTHESLWSDEMIRICGWTRETFDRTYEAFLDLIHPEDRENVKEALHKTLAEETKTEIAYRLVRRDGSVREVLQRAEVLSEDAGKNRRLMSTLQDMTLQNQAERELQKTRDLLMQSEKLVSIGRLSAGVAHEILNPLNVISVELQLLLKTEALSPEVKSELTVCMEQVKRIVVIAEGLKQLSRLPVQKTTKHDLGRVIDHILSLSSSQLKIEGIETDVLHSPDLPAVSMDREKIEQVILNLITNAIDAMEGKEKKVLRISTRKETLIGEEDGVRVVIADSGTGIPAKDMPVLFDPFFTTKEPGKGTGLGLFISYGIIHEHRGRIWAENNEWGGASFFIELPAAPDARENDSEERG